MTAVAGKHTNIDRRGLPRLSPALAGSALAALLGGAASVDHAASGAVIAR